MSPLLSDPPPAPPVRHDLSTRIRLPEACWLLMASTEARADMESTASRYEPLIGEALASFDAGDDVALPHAPAHIGVIIPFVAMSLLGTLPGSSARPLNVRDCIQQRECFTLVVHVGCRQQCGQR